MTSPAPQSPLFLGQLVQHCSDPAKAVGILLGWVFDPPLGALVRWRDGTATFEVSEDIKNAISISAAVSVAEQIRRRIERGILPVAAPVKTASVTHAQWQPCDACDDLIAPEQVAYVLDYLAPPRVVRLHRGCHSVWEVEVFRRDGRVEHGPEPSRKPLARIVPEEAADPICPGCSGPIRPADSVAKNGDHILHIRCLVRRPIAGGAPLPVWNLIGDEHIGRRLGRTRDGHRDFMAACAETLVRSRQIVARARRVAAEARSVRRSVAA
jgi:hypothetical protein